MLLGSTPGDPLKSWDATPAVPPWLFQPTSQVASTGMAQTTVDADPAAILVAYSWLDLSATPEDSAEATVNLSASGSGTTLLVGDTSQLSAGMTVTGAGIPSGTSVLGILSPTQVRLTQAVTGTLAAEQVVFSGIDLETMIRSLLDVGQSESRTQWAGLMLAEAIEQAVAADFFGANQGLVHIMGQSHGAKVAPVATVALEAADIPVSQLTVVDSPETGPSAPIPLDAHGVGGGQNFVWKFLQELPSGRISKTPVAVGRQATDGTFVDNYYSVTGFGENFNGDVAFLGVDAGEAVQLVVSVHGMAVPQINLSDPPLLASGSTGFMTIPLLTLDGRTSGAGPRMATISLDVFRNQTIIAGAFSTAANPVPQLVFSLIGSAGATASATVTNMRQFGTPTNS